VKRNDALPINQEETCVSVAVAVSASIAFHHKRAVIIIIIIINEFGPQQQQQQRLAVKIPSVERCVIITLRETHILT
jgi:hypothetical protein